MINTITVTVITIILMLIALPFMWRIAKSVAAFLAWLYEGYREAFNNMLEDIAHTFKSTFL
jgi:hypothetical protein